MRELEILLDNLGVSNEDELRQAVARADDALRRGLVRTEAEAARFVRAEYPWLFHPTRKNLLGLANQTAAAAPAVATGLPTASAQLSATLTVEKATVQPIKKDQGRPPSSRKHQVEADKQQAPASTDQA